MITDLIHFRWQRDKNGDAILYDKKLNSSFRIPRRVKYSVISFLIRSQTRDRLEEKAKVKVAKDKVIKNLKARYQRLKARFKEKRSLKG